MRLIEDAPVLLAQCYSIARALKNLVREVERERSGEQLRFVALALQEANDTLDLLQEHLEEKLQ